MLIPPQTRRSSGPADELRFLGSFPPSELVRVLSMVLGRNVIDKTGVTDVFDVQIDFVPDETTPAMPPPPPGTPITGVAIATALRQQLGLRLENDRGVLK